MKKLKGKSKFDNIEYVWQAQKFFRTKAKDAGWTDAHIETIFKKLGDPDINQERYIEELLEYFE